MVANTAYRITGVAIGSLRSTGGTEIWAAATKGSDERGRGEKGSDGVFAKLPNWFFGIFWRVLDARIVLQTPACTESSRAGHHSLPCTVMMKLGVNIQRYVQDPTLMERASRTEFYGLVYEGRRRRQFGARPRGRVVIGPRRLFVEVFGVGCGGRLVARARAWCGGGLSLIHI